MVPKVRLWLVRYHFDRKPYIDAIVQAPTAQFARWAARDELMLRYGGTAFAVIWRDAVRVTATVHRRHASLDPLDPVASNQDLYNEVIRDTK